MKLRLATPHDAPALLDIYSPFIEETPVTFEVVVPPVQAFAGRIEETLRTHPWLVAESEGDVPAVLGYAYAGPHRTRVAYQWSVEVSAYLAASAQRRGVGRTLYRALFAILTQQGFRNAYAGITVPNVQSVAFHEAMGFAPIGIYPHVGHKLGAWRDVGWWGLDLRAARGKPEDQQTPPAPPKPLPALSKEAVAAVLAALPLAPASS